MGTMAISSSKEIDLSIPAEAVVTCPLQAIEHNNATMVRVVSTCTDCEYFGGFWSINENPARRFDSRFQIKCKYPRALNLAWLEDA